MPVDRGMRLFGMRNRKACCKRRSSGQALIETALLMPFMLALIFNAVNFGWFFYVALNISSGSRSGDLYAMLGSQTPVDPSGIHTGEYAPPGAGGTLTGCIGTADCTVQAVMYQDMNGSLPFAASSATVKVCSSSVGLTVTGGQTLAQCKVFTSATDAGTVTGTAPVDPEQATTGYKLHEVDVTYTFTPLIPGRVFGAVLLALPVCNSAGTSCTLHKAVYMRAMGS